MWMSFSVCAGALELALQRSVEQMMMAVFLTISCKHIIHVLKEACLPIKNRTWSKEKSDRLGAPTENKKAGIWTSLNYVNRAFKYYGFHLTLFRQLTLQAEVPFFFNGKYIFPTKQPQIQGLLQELRWIRGPWKANFFSHAPSKNLLYRKHLCPNKALVEVVRAAR